MIYDEVSLYVTKIYCKSKFDMTRHHHRLSGQIVEATGCTGDRTEVLAGECKFEVWLYGNPNNDHRLPDGRRWQGG